jgi:hypothetical protein
VVRRINQSADLAIVIRGTNFFSLGDWLSNFPIDPMPWEYGASEPVATLTRSTAYGLRILQQLRAEPVPPRDAALTPEERADAAVLADEAAVAYQLLEKILTDHEPEDLTAHAASLGRLVHSNFTGWDA